MKHIFDHQLQQFLTYLRWSLEWSDGCTPGEADKIYLLGCAETSGHLLACWLVQVCGAEYCETAAGTNMLFSKAGQPYTMSRIERNIRAFLKDAEVEVKNG